MSREERTGWRDERISRRHRLWGVGCSASDIDFLLIEYKKCEAVALVEYKHERSTERTYDNSNYKALIGLGNKAELPVFVVRYADDFSTFTVIPVNGYASKYFKQEIKLSECQWVQFLYILRGELLPDEVKNNIREEQRKKQGEIRHEKRCNQTT